MKFDPSDLIRAMYDFPIFRGTSVDETASPGKWWSADRAEASYDAGTGASYDEGANVMMALLNREGFPRVDAESASYDRIPVRSITDPELLHALERYLGSRPWEDGYVSTYDIAQAVEHSKLPGVELTNVTESSPHQFYVADSARRRFLFDR